MAHYKLRTPLSEADIRQLKLEDTVSIDGIIFGISAALIPGGAIAGLAICVNLVVDWLMKRTSSLKGRRGDA